MIRESTLRPTASEERVVILDVLRGFAMFGVLWSNLHFWFGGRSVTPLDNQISWVVDWMVDSRLYSLLGFLFGIGFAMQLRRAPTGDSEARTIFCRRMFVLLGIGLFHGLFIWSGDILTRFALLGFLLVLYSGLSQRRLIVAAALTYLIVPFALTRLQFLLNLPRGGGGFYLGKAGASILAQGTFSQIAIYRVEDFLVHLRNTALTGGFAGFLTLFILGMWALRAGLLARLAEKKWLWRALATALLTMAVGIHWNAHAREWWPAPTVAPAQRGWRDVNLWLPRAAFYGIGYTLQVWANSAAYLCVLSLVALRARGRTMLAPLAAVGRMPLTTYLMQSVVCTVLFYNFGFGLFGKVTATGMLAISLALFALQILASVYWFRHYRFGPAEWVWRSLTYGESQPMVQTTSATAKTRTAQVLS